MSIRLVAIQGSIRPDSYTGRVLADRAGIPEWDLCQALGIELVTGVGLEKAWSSSDYLEAWGAFWMRTHGG